MDRTDEQLSGESYPNVMQVDSNLDVTNKLTAPTCEFGVDTCKIIVDRDTNNVEHLKIVLPNDGKANGINSTQTYDMRSIIESIQELNRRTATFNCNVSFNAALEAYDISPSPNANFACDLDKDGLPAATNGSTNIPPLTEENKYRVLLCVNHEPVDNLHEDTGLVIDLTETDKNSIDLSKNAAVLGYIDNYNTNHGGDKITYLEAHPNIHSYDETTRTVVIKVLTSGYFKNANGPWEYVYRTWNVPAEGSIDEDLNINYTVLSARYNFNRSDTYYKGDRFKSPMTSMFRIGELRSDPVGFPTDQANGIYITECVYQFSPLTISTDGNYTQTVLTNIALKNIDLAYHDVSRVTNMYGMFHKNYVLTELQIPETFDTSGVITFHSMFHECSALKELSLPKSFDTSNAVSLYGLFSNTSSLSTIIFNTSFNTSNALILNNMFRSCGVRGLLNLPSGFTAISAKGLGITALFAHMPNCDSIKFPPGFEVGPNVTSYYAIFRYSNFRYLTLPSAFFPVFPANYKPDFNFVFEGDCLLTQLFLPDNFKLEQFSDIGNCLSGLLSLSLISIGDYGTNHPTLTTVNNATNFILDSNWIRLSTSNIYTRNFKNFSINCSLLKQPNTDMFDATLDISRYPIRPGCQITLMGLTEPTTNGPLPNPITIQAGITTYNTYFDLSSSGGPSSLSVTVEISEDYSSMKITSETAQNENGSWHIDWIYIIKVTYP